MTLALRGRLIDQNMIEWKTTEGKKDNLKKVEKFQRKLRIRIKYHCKETVLAW